MSNAPLSTLAPGVTVPGASIGSVTTQGNVAWSKSGPTGMAQGEANWAKTSDCPPVQADHHHHHHGHGGYGRGTNWAWIIFLFIIIAIVIWLILVFFKPKFVQKKTKHGQPTGEIDNGLAVLWAIIIAIIICIIVWIVKLAASC